MGLIAGLIRALFLRGGAAEIGRAGVEVVDALRPNATRQMELGHEAFGAAQTAYAAEFVRPRGGWFDALVNGLNRLPRPVLALSTPALFAYAMADPDGFTLRMQGLAAVPEPLWWLLGAVVAFYFGARETYYFRNRSVISPFGGAEAVPEDNAALDEWRAGRG